MASEDINFSALDAMCRTCLGYTKDLEPLENQNNSGVSTKEMLLSFCKVELNEIEMSLPNAICKECSLEVRRVYSFKLKCENNDYILRCRIEALKNESKDEVILKEEKLDVEEQSFKEETPYLMEFLGSDIKEENCNYNDSTYSDTEYGTCQPYTTRARRKNKKKTDRRQSKENRLKPISKPEKKENENTDGDVDKIKDETRKCGKPGRKKKMRPISEFVDDSSTTLGYKQLYECPKCRAFFKTFRMLYKHMVKVHQVTLDSLEQYTTLCTAAFGEREKNIKLNLLDFKNPRYKCLDCSYMSKNFDALKKHIINEHRGERYIQCDECEYKTTHLTMLVRHKRMHSGERRFACPECFYRSSSNYQLNLHITAHHSTHKAFVCDVCAQAFKTKISLVNHMTRVHINKREHVCPICSKAFNMKKDLKNHSLIHSGQRPHVCEHCGLAFTQRANLEKHVQMIHLSNGERPFPCSECNYKAKSVYSLKSHMYKHSLTKKFSCHLCNHKTSTKYALKTHIQRHLGDKRYHCKSCTYSCYDAQTLVVHNRIHTGERPFQCSLCPYRSRTNQRLRNHMKSHLNEQKFSCQHCPYRSNYKANLIVHLKKNCGRDSRPYTPRKSQAAVNIGLIQSESLASSNSQSHRNSVANIQDMDLQNDMKIELNTSNTVLS